jgi:hypothetical protein
MNYVEALENVVHCARRCIGPGTVNFPELSKALALLDATPYFKTDRVSYDGPPVSNFVSSRQIVVEPQPTATFTRDLFPSGTDHYIDSGKPLENRDENTNQASMQAS